MGLAVSVGNPGTGYDEEGEEHYRRQFEKVAAALAAKGHEWTPPNTAPPVGQARRHVGSFPYSCLHYLRRAYALKYEGRPVTPVVDGDLKSADRYVDDAASMFDSHLLCHADDAGYYVPISMSDPAFLPRESGIAGGAIVGSSHGLLDELRRIAADVGVRLEPDGTLSDAEAQRLGDNDGDPYATEQMVWLTLHETCRVSVATGHAVVFH
jgi:hypothetical protein